MIQQMQAVASPNRHRAGTRGNVQHDHGCGASTPGTDTRVLILCRDRLASLVIAQNLPPSSRGVHGEAAEEALHQGRLANCSVAFIDCDLPDYIFRKVHDSRHDPRGGMRVIGVRGKDPWRPMKLLAERKILSYVRMPMPMEVIRTLIGNLSRDLSVRIAFAPGDVSPLLNAPLASSGASFFRRHPRQGA